MTQSKHQTTSASQQVAQVVERMRTVHDAFWQSIKRYRSQKRAEGVARIYLERSDLPRMLLDLEKLPPSVEVADEKQQRRLEGTLMRAAMSLQFVESGDGDAFEKAQVLEDAVRDFGLRLRERGLLLETVPTLPVGDYELVGVQQVCMVPPRKNANKASEVDYGHAA